MSAFGFRKASDLPAIVPLFPLTSAIVFPRGQLPLHIFEPRYLNMVDDALAANRVIAMIQPLPNGPEEALAAVGTLGRITSFSETDDGRYMLTLTGLARFRLVEELPVKTPYRQARADFAAFERDLSAPKRTSIDRERLRTALQAYVDTHGFEADWSAVDNAPSEALVNAVATLCPFDAAAKQALLETETLPDRCAALIALLEMEAAPDLSGRLQ